MAKANPASYQEMIAKLGEYLSAASECCSAVTQAGADLVSNTEDDPNATRANTKLQKCISDINSELEAIGKIQQALQQELEEILKTNSVSFDD